MNNNSLGEVIRSLRKQSGLSQEQLAEGICSPVSISRIENGSQMPSSTVLEELLCRLGTSTYQLCDIYYKNGQQLSFEAEAEYVTNLISAGNYEQAQKQLLLLEPQIGDSANNRQYFLLLKASLGLYQQQSPQEILHTLEQALSLTKPDFHYSDFRAQLLSIPEANILNIIVVTLFKLNRTLDAIRLGEELMVTLKKHKSHLKEYHIMKINLSFNLAQCMEKEARYKEAMAYAELAEALSISSAEQMLLPEIEFIKAKIYHLLNQDADCINILKAIVPYMELIHKNEFAGYVRNYAKEELSLSL